MSFRYEYGLVVDSTTRGEAIEKALSPFVLGLDLGILRLSQVDLSDLVVV